MTGKIMFNLAEVGLLIFAEQVHSKRFSPNAFCRDSRRRPSSLEKRFLSGLLFGFLFSCYVIEGNETESSPLGEGSSNTRGEIRA